MKVVKFRQKVWHSIKHTTHCIPTILELESDKYRNIIGHDRVIMPCHRNGYDKYEGALRRVAHIMEKKGWRTRYYTQRETIHEHMYIMWHHLHCWK